MLLLSYKLYLQMKFTTVQIFAKHFNHFSFLGVVLFYPTNTRSKVNRFINHWYVKKVDKLDTCHPIENYIKDRFIPESEEKTALS